ncbi:MAG: ribosome-associated protein YbcJ (S4-like RNA binding protein) [Moritella sp.]|jgi:ribosome-associated protein YbcJ (S4-like RNA binding protein)
MSEEYEIEVIPVVVSAEPIELYKILKIENLVTSGSEAKSLIADGYVYVNGEVETRKRKKIMYGDIIGFDGEAYQVLSAADLLEYETMDDDGIVEPADADVYIESISESEPEPEPLLERPEPVAGTDRPTAITSVREAKKTVADKPKKKKSRAAPFSF